MWKKLLILLLVLLFIGMSSIPIWLKKMADDAFANPQRPISSEAVSKAIKAHMYIFLFDDARRIAEKGVIYFPESSDVPFYMYNAAICSEKSGSADAAIYWYNRFIGTYPNHEWKNQAQRNLDRLKHMK